MSSSSLPADLSILESRLTSARAGYIDNLSAGAAALQSTAAAIPTTPINKIIRVSTSIASGTNWSNTTIPEVVIAKTVIANISVRSGNTVGQPADEDPFFVINGTTNLYGVCYALIGTAVYAEVWLVEYK